MHWPVFMGYKLLPQGYHQITLDIGPDQFEDWQRKAAFALEACRQPPQVTETLRALRDLRPKRHRNRLWVRDKKSGIYIPHGMQIPEIEPLVQQVIRSLPLSAPW